MEYRDIDSDKKSRKEDESMSLPHAMEYRDIDSDGHKDLVMSLDCH